ncbi:MAG TPA: methylated-DNA--[protein]-cysteine S-methyltransferase [Acidimicrobiales bacterium]|nr:methylated-DNA--[protein]-cysteine S-methyltransferase [Acidimicrobiales bacterium]
MTDLFPAAAEGDAVGRLRSRLASGADAAGLLDVAYRSVDSPVGPLLLAATPLGVVRIAFDVQGHDAALAELAANVGPRVLRAGARLDEPTRQLEEFFTGRRRRFELPLDLRLAGGFRRRVAEALAGIGYGETVGYGALAARLGAPGAARAVGTGCARNPLPVVLPCHRVVRADGSVGDYAGGADAKRWLLDLERGDRGPAPAAACRVQPA